MMTLEYTYTEAKLQDLERRINQLLTKFSNKKSTMQPLQVALDNAPQGNSERSTRYHFLLTALVNNLKTTSPGWFSQVSTRRDDIYKILKDQVLPNSEETLRQYGKALCEKDINKTGQEIYNKAYDKAFNNYFPEEVRYQSSGDVYAAAHLTPGQEKHLSCVHKAEVVANKYIDSQFNKIEQLSFAKITQTLTTLLEENKPKTDFAIELTSMTNSTRSTLFGNTESNNSSTEEGNSPSTTNSR